MEEGTFLIRQSPEGLYNRYNLDLRSRTELVNISRKQHSILVKPVDGTDSYHLEYDKLILAQGAYYCATATAGIGEGSVFPFQTLLDLHRIRD